MNRLNYSLLAASLVLLVLGTLRILYREVKAQGPSPYAVLALLLVWMVALALRLELSPRTFLHEYYHPIRVPGSLAAATNPAYGDTPSTLFHAVATILQRPDDVQVIFLTNAVISSLAIPAVALLDLALMGSWPRALCAAVLLCVLPLHLRFSAAEDVFVQGVTFGLWALGLFALYLRTRRLGDALVAALALSLAIQTRPEMMFLPAACVALVLVAQPRSWRVLVEGRILFALAVVGMLQLPRLPGLREAAHPHLINVFPTLQGYLNWLVLLQSQVTPTVYLLFLVVGLTWGVWRKPGVHLWVIVVFAGYTLFSCSNGDNPPYNLRTQLLPTSLTVLIAAGTASVWMELWRGRYRRPALTVGACALVILGTIVVVRSRGFVTELRDQQLEWAFIQRAIPQLPEGAVLLWAGPGPVEDGSLPQVLLRRAKIYDVVDVQQAERGDVAWPIASENLLYYQGMHCYFAFDHEPPPDPMSAFCRAVHERYVMEPLLIEDLNTQAYSTLRYAGDGRGPFRIGFFRLKAER